MILESLPKRITDYLILKAPWRFNKQPDVFLSEDGSPTIQKTTASDSQDELNKTPYR